MQRKVIFIGTLGALAVAIWLGLHVGSSPPIVVKASVQAGPQVDRAPPVLPSPSAPNAAGGPMKPGEKSPWPGVVRTTSLEPPTPPPQPPTGGEMLHQWLTSSQDTVKIAENIFQGWPKLKTEDHKAAVKALLPFVTDDRYAGLQRLLLDQKTSYEAKDVLFKNLTRRPKDIQLPTLLAILRQSPSHPCEAEARQELYVRMGADYGYDWATWEARIAEELGR